nr:hypothetical protein [Streptomyces qaidamensis]
MNTAARVALRSGLPLAVLPGRTFNHFACDLSVEDVRDLARALRQGDAVRVAAGPSAAPAGGGGPSACRGHRRRGRRCPGRPGRGASGSRRGRRPRTRARRGFASRPSRAGRGPPPAGAGLRRPRTGGGPV